MKENEREGCFAKPPVEHIGIKNLKSWTSVNRGAIILSTLLQSSLIKELQIKSQVDGKA